MDDEQDKIEGASHREVRRIGGTDWDIRSEHEEPVEERPVYEKTTVYLPLDSYSQIYGSGTQFIAITALTPSANLEAKLEKFFKSLDKLTQISGYTFGDVAEGYGNSRAERRGRQFARRTKTAGWDHDRYVQGSKSASKKCKARY